MTSNAAVAASTEYVGYSPQVPTPCQFCGTCPTCGRVNAAPYHFFPTTTWYVKDHNHDDVLPYHVTS